MRRPFHVVIRGKSNFEIVLIDLDDVLYVATQNGEKYLHTQNGVFNYITRPEEHERFLELQGFIKTDRCFMVQKDKVEFYDEETHKLYFQEPVDKDSPNAPVSRTHMKEIEDIRRATAFESRPRFGIGAQERI